MAEEFNKGRGEAVQALLNALGDTEYNGQKPSPEMVQQMADRLNAMLGEPNEVNADGSTVDDRGEVLNEDGEPVIEINEPMASQSGIKSKEETLDEDPLVPFVDMTPEERAWHRTETSRILDMLEEEENQASATEREKSKAAMEKRKIEAQKRGGAVASTKKQDGRIDEKKMGKALLKDLSRESSNGSESKPGTPSNAPSTTFSKDPEAHSDTRSSQKKVTFSDDASTSQKHLKTKMEWGDVVAALPSSSSRRLIQKQNTLMQTQVVERFPARSGYPQPLQSLGDSDDESLADDDALQYNSAQHQKEIEKEYQARRQNILDALPDAMKGMSISNEQSSKVDWDQENVPLDASLSSKPQPKGKSRFKASLENSMLPESSSATLRASIKRGKLEDEKLTGSAEESDPEDIIQAREALLRTNSTQEDSGSSTPVSSDMRSSPKLPDTYTSSPLASLAPRKPSAQNAPARPQSGTATKRTATNASVMHPQPAPATPTPMIIESPSFAAPNSASKGINSPLRVPIVAEMVREATPLRKAQAPDPDQEDAEATPRRISRFKAERAL